MRATATLHLTLAGRLRAPRPLAPALARLGLLARGRLRYPRLIRGRADLGISAYAIAPRGLGARLDVVTDRYTSAVLKQTLQVWIMATQPALRVAVAVDDGPLVARDLVRLNPNGNLPAIYTVDSQGLPQDGKAHLITVSAWTTRDGRRGADARIRFVAKLAPVPVPMPEWISARLLRQNSTELPDLVEIHWRAATPVTLIANLRAAGYAPVTLRLGASDRSPLVVEGIGTKFEGYFDNKLYPVYFGAFGIRQGQESPTLWDDQPLLIQNSDGTPAKTLISPDTQAGTARTLKGVITTGNTYTTEYPFRSEIEAAVRAGFTTLPANASTLIDHAISKFFLKIKDHLRKDDQVTLDDLALIRPVWSKARTRLDPVTRAPSTIPAQRQIAFKPSLGFQAGTRLGVILTDAQAKELQP